MPNIIIPVQPSFAINRTIDENVMIIKEMAHIFNKASKKLNLMALKIDLSKAFDSLEWSFIHETLVIYNIPMTLVNLIMNCVTTSSISEFWNGQITDHFLPCRGIRQGDPLSPFIFVLCLERLSQMIENKVNTKL